MTDIRTTCYTHNVRACADAYGLPLDSSADDVLKAVARRVTQPDSIGHLTLEQRLALIHALSTPKENHA